MVDEDVMEHINQYNKEHATPEAKAVAMMLSGDIEQLALLIGKAYQTNEELGTKIFSSILTTIIVATSKNIDQAIERLDKIYKNVREDMIRLDKRVNTK